VAPVREVRGRTGLRGTAAPQRAQLERVSTRPPQPTWVARPMTILRIARASCSPSRYAFLERFAARDPDGDDQGAGQRRWSVLSKAPAEDSPVRSHPRKGTCSLAGRCLPEREDDQPLRWSSAWWSPPPESNRRPHPYHGTTGNRCAERRFPGSRPTVGAKVIGSLSAKLCAHVTNRSEPTSTRLQGCEGRLIVACWHRAGRCPARA
jgi:hypothetical protein